MPLQKFRSAEDMNAAPVLVRPGEGFDRFVRHCERYWQIALRVVLPQLWPRLIDALRLGLGSAWLFLIAAEAIASTEGLGYRIFLVRRYLAMDVILPYVVWITLLAVLMDRGLGWLRARMFPWAEAGR